ncbi:MAG: hypothetical protein OZ948_06650 [Deltaproteobacteria bacterium]|nr:hypothetical protein [Deltaproteobacteria bacterium]
MRRSLRAAVVLGTLLWPVGSGRGLAAQDPPTPSSGVAAAPSEEGELAPLLRQVQTRLEELDRRERELAERERSLGELSTEATRTIDTLAALRGTVDQRIATLEALRGDGVGRLAKVYATMPPARAAALLERLEPEVATALVGRMKGKRSAAVLASMAPESALRISRATVLPLPAAGEAAAPEAGAGDPAPARTPRLVR